MQVAGHNTPVINFHSEFILAIFKTFNQQIIVKVSHEYIDPVNRGKTYKESLIKEL